MNPVPWLRSGVGQTPTDGGCIMQVIDWIHREEWTDAPPCVHPVIRRIAISINDSANDEERQKLLDLAPRMMGTANDDAELSRKLAIFCAEYVLPIFEAQYPDDDRPRKAIEAAKSGDKFAARAAAYAAARAAAYDDADAAAAYDDADAAAAARAAVYAAAARAAVYAAADAAAYATYAAEDKLEFLVVVLDEYDRIMGRDKTHSEIDWNPVVCAMTNSLEAQ